MSQDNLTTQYISSTFQRLLQLSDNGGYVTDGTGSLVSFLPISVNNALTASYVPGVTATIPGDGLWAIQFNSASVFQGSNNLLFDAVANTLQLTGSFNISGSINFNVSSSATIIGPKYIDFDTVQTPLPANSEGRLYWNSTDKTLTLGLEKGFYTDLNHQLLVRVVNKTGFDLVAGTVVYITGSFGGRPSVATASWTGDQTSAATLGLVATEIKDNNNGYVVTRGILENVNTNGLTVGKQLYLSSSGQFTTTHVDAPLHEVRLGKVLTSGVAGSIYVDIVNGYELDELHDVKATNPDYGDLFMYSASLWTATKQLSGSYGITGSLNIDGNLFINGVSVGPGGSETDPIFVAKSGSLATTGSNVFIGDQQITGSVYITGSFGLTSYGSVEPTSIPDRVGLFYFTDTNFYVSLQ